MRRPGGAPRSRGGAARCGQGSRAGAPGPAGATASAPAGTGGVRLQRAPGMIPRALRACALRAGGRVTIGAAGAGARAAAVAPAEIRTTELVSPVRATCGHTGTPRHRFVMSRSLPSWWRSAQQGMPAVGDAAPDLGVEHGRRLLAVQGGEQLVGSRQ
ncbi:hypothetical protein GCM10028832_04470 [Streptomyces sparsus]